MRAISMLLLLGGCEYGWDDPADDMASLSDIVDLSVNQASATMDGAELVLRAESGDNAAGGFNGSGTGNKSIAGLPGWDGALLASLDELVYESAPVTGSWTPYWNVVVDLDGTGCDLKIVVADASGATATDLGDGVTRYSFDADAEIWRAVGGLDDILPSHLDSAAGVLSDVVAAHPYAVLRDAETGDNGMPAGEETTALMLIVGDSLNTSEAEERVTAIEVDGERFVGP